MNRTRVCLYSANVSQAISVSWAKHFLYAFKYYIPAYMWLSIGTTLASV